MQPALDRSTINDLQAFLRKAGSNKLWIDGDFGKLTVKSLQYQLRRGGSYVGELDGSFNGKTVMAMQRFLGFTETAVDGNFGEPTLRRLQSVLDSQKAHLHVCALRVADDGHAYVLEEFMKYYGDSVQQKWESATEVAQTCAPPRGLSVAGVSISTSQDALTELLPHFTRWGHAIEIGLDIDKEQKPWRVRRAQAGGLRNFPNVHALIKDCHRQFNGGVWDSKALDQGLINVTCRRYMHEQGLKFHVDRSQFYETDVYGCVLENTSREMLEFHRKLNGAFLRYATDEHPGVVYRQTGDSRFEWSHGVFPLRQGRRVSVSWRWFKRRCLSHDSLTTVCGPSVDNRPLRSASDPWDAAGPTSSMGRRSASSIDGDSIGASDISDWSFVFARTSGSVISASSFKSAGEFSVPVVPEDSVSNLGVIDVGGSVISAQSLHSASSDLSMLSTNGPHCFLPGTFLPSSLGCCQSVEELREGDSALSSDGTELTIRSVTVHPNEPQPCVLLCAGNVVNEFTESHRVSVWRGGRKQAVKAVTLRQGDDVFISDGSTKDLTTVRPFNKTCPVYEFEFAPDLPVESFMLPSSILSHGRKPPRSHRNAHQGSELTGSIPDTDSELDKCSLDQLHSLPRELTKEGLRVWQQAMWEVI